MLAWCREIVICYVNQWLIVIGDGDGGGIDWGVCSARTLQYPRYGWAPSNISG